MRGGTSGRGGAQRLCVAWCMQCRDSAWSATLLRSAQHDTAWHSMARGSRARIVVRELLPVSIAVARAGREDPGPCLPLCRAVRLASVESCSPRRPGGSRALPGSAQSRASGQRRVVLAASAERILGPVRLCAEQCARCARLAVGSGGGHLRIWRAAPGRAH
jgi:hypothetical protein